MQTSFLHFCYSDDFFLDLESTRSLPIIWLVDISRAGIPLRCTNFQLRCTHIPLRCARKPTEMRLESHWDAQVSHWLAHIPPRCAKILNLYTLSSMIAVFIPDKRQNMFHELRNWRNHCLHSLLKVPISKIFFKSYISFFCS